MKLLTVTDQVQALLKVHEAAGPLRCSAKQVRRLIDAGLLKAVRLGRSARSDRIHPADLEDYINRSRKYACPSSAAATPGRSRSIGKVSAIVDLLGTGPVLKRVK